MGARQGRRAGKKAVFIGRYLYRPIDTSATFFFMPNQTSVSLADWEAQYARLRGCLAQVGWISDGYVQDRGPGAGGPCYQWTRKVKGKTVSVALSKRTVPVAAFGDNPVAPSPSHTQRNATLKPAGPV